MPPTPCKPQVELLIDLVNDCGQKPMEIITVNNFRDLKTACKKLSELVDGKTTSRRSDILLVTLGNIAREYIWHGLSTDCEATEEFDGSFMIENALRRYDELRRARIIFNRIVKLSELPHEERSKPMLMSSASFEEMRLVKTDQYHQGRREPEYEIRIAKQPTLLHALDGEPARIRNCERIVKKHYKCGRFFWEGRADKEVCDKCGDAMRAARYRAEKRKRSSV